MKKNLIYGLHPVIEAVKAGKSIDKLFIQQGLKGNLISELKALLQEKNIRYKIVPVEKLNRLTKENHQGVVGFISPIRFQNLEENLEKIDLNNPATFILLDGITDPRNFGAIVRTAAATNVTGIIISENNSAPVNEDVIKTSAGGIFKVPVYKINHLKDAIFLLQSYGIKIVSATEKADNLVYNANLYDSFALIMGSEGKGIHPSILKMSDDKIKLPMSEHINSLNVSVACGVILYECVRQRLSRKK
jgi:23S rRNA (guanosine2251-2'-O)-methyltransferase